MDVYQFDQIKDEIITLLQGHRLIPILGSGFSVGSPSKNGQVPSGEIMRDYMINKIEEKNGKSDDLRKKLLSQISTYYNKIVSREEKKVYIRDNFTEVELSTIKQQFLEIDWLYIYTLNIDDGIEKCSKYNNIILSNRSVDFSSLDDDSCVIKLHGDARTYLNYLDDNCSIFDFKQYANSIITNNNLLEKLRDDFTYNNLLFIGCSLDSEFDLATIDKYGNDNAVKKTKKIFCTTTIPDQYKQIELSGYGISHIVIFNNHDDIYESIYKTYQESKLMPQESIDDYQNLPVKTLGISFQENRPYLFHSKSLVNTKMKEIILPNFFIERYIAKEIINNLEYNNIHILYSGRVTGKTYILVSLVQLIKDRKVYFFNSQTSVPKTIIDILLKKENAVFIFDTNSTNKNILFDIIKRQRLIHNNNSNVIITVNKSDKEIISVLNITENKDIFRYEIKSRFDSKEIKRLNQKMAINELPNYDISRTIIDNIVHMERDMGIHGQYSRNKPLMRHKDDMVVLLLLAIREKLYTSDLSLYNIDKECYEQIRRTEPLIQEDYALFFERTMENPSEKKIVLNAKYWLYRHLGEFAHKQENYKIIIDAYIHIISTIIKTKRNVVRPIEFIKFDVINEIFQTNYKGQVSLAKAIYEGLNTLLADNPHYYHQRAKCLLWQSGQSSEYSEQLNDALRYVNIASHNLDIEYRRTNNEKILISLAHVYFTTALILSKLCVINKFNDFNFVCKAIDLIHKALTNSFNLNEIFEKSDKYDMESVIKYAMINIDKFEKNKVSEIYRVYTDIQLLR
jgi:hypothetical protein